MNTDLDKLIPMDPDKEQADKYQQALLDMLAKRRMKQQPEPEVEVEPEVEPDLRSEAIRNLASNDPRIGENPNPDIIGVGDPLDSEVETPNDNFKRIQEIVDMLRK